MKKGRVWIGLVGLILLCPLGAAAQSAAVGLYNEANALYRQGEFDRARQLYQQAVDAGAQDPRLFYNLGCAHFKAGAVGAAIVWFERALRLAPGDEDIRANLRFANQVKKDQESAEDTNVIWNFLVAVFHYPSLNSLAVVFSLALTGVMGLSLWRLWRRPFTGFVGLLVGAGVVLVGSAGVLASRAYIQAQLVEAVVIQDQTQARSGPDEAQTEVFTVHEGTKVRVVRQEGAWLLVRLANGVGGWMPAQALTII